MNDDQLQQFEHQGVDIEMTASSVNRLMNQRYHEVILVAIKRAALSKGWYFKHTKVEHLMPYPIRVHLASVIWPAAHEHTHPNLRSAIGSELYEQWRLDAELDGWATAWLDHVLEALRQLGIRPVPCDSVEGPNDI